ncbi:MAG: hypothetical protein M1834_000069 [Cirrosporium novae-zelandiae]|nr:MAG: hypothetical protein M1834_000069 [Cirrosporium novae-zelandiae]
MHRQAMDLSILHKSHILILSIRDTLTKHLEPYKSFLDPTGTPTFGPAPFTVPDYPCDSLLEQEKAWIRLKALHTFRFEFASLFPSFFIWRVISYRSYLFIGESGRCTTSIYEVVGEYIRHQDQDQDQDHTHSQNPNDLDLTYLWRLIQESYLLLLDEYWDSELKSESILEFMMKYLRDEFRSAGFGEEEIWELWELWEMELVEVVWGQEEGVAELDLDLGKLERICAGLG